MEHPIQLTKFTATLKVTSHHAQMTGVAWNNPSYPPGIFAECMLDLRERMIQRCKDNWGPRCRIVFTELKEEVIQQNADGTWSVIQRDIY